MMIERGTGWIKVHNVSSEVADAIEALVQSPPRSVHCDEGEALKGLEMMILVWSNRPANEAGEIWRQGCIQGFKWGREFPNGDGWKPHKPNCDCSTFCSGRDVDRGGVVRATCKGLPAPPSEECSK